MQTVKLAQEFPELLAIEDTTSLSYRHQVAEELGKLGSIQDKSRGWWVHSVLGIERQHIISELKKDNPRSAPRVAPAISATLPLQRHLVLRS